MNTSSSQKWFEKQLCDISIRLYRQGYSQERIEYLLSYEPEFHDQYYLLMESLEIIMDKMSKQPESYTLYESFTKAKRALLEYTNLNRSRFLEMGLAETA